MLPGHQMQEEKMRLPKETYRYGEGKAGNRNRENCAFKVVIK